MVLQGGDLGSEGWRHRSHPVSWLESPTGPGSGAIDQENLLIL